MTRALLISLLVAGGTATAQVTFSVPAAPAEVYVADAPLMYSGEGALAEAGHEQDPDYRSYQEGYRLVLDGKWKEAKARFDTFLKEYPHSKFIDDATYWSAYAQMHFDRKAATTAYLRFLTRFPASRYYDDALADLTEINKGHPLVIGKFNDGKGTGVYVGSGATGMHVDTSGAVIWNESEAGRDSVVIDRNGKVTKQAKKSIEYSYGYTTRSGGSIAHIEALGRALQRMRLPRVWPPMAPVIDEQKLDQSTRLRIEALRALDRSENDTNAFRVLREVAMDRSNARPLRFTAMEKLSELPGVDPLPVFVEIAKTDTGEEIQNFAVDQIGMLPGDKNRCVETLIDLFYAIPSSREQRREAVFYSIAEVGNDRAVDFLARVAQHDENYDLRSQAIYYLGNIGTPKARTALYDILKQK